MEQYGVQGFTDRKTWTPARRHAGATASCAVPLGSIQLNHPG
ncbi:MAG: hypothetical protein KCHDKBKB_00080 [Elusimicrobia bacterium]|nr:hypothetical protein [Elusimicrobiota bacterium]